MSQNLLEIKNLHVKVEEKEILKGLNLSIPYNETHAIMGPNGAGKSVLSNVLSGNDDYSITDGQIFFKDEEISDLKPNEISNLIISYLITDTYDLEEEEFFFTNRKVDLLKFVGEY